MTNREGQQIDHYRLLKLLGRGGFAEVYLGEHLYLKTPVAVKLLYAHLAQKDRHAFLQEAQTIARLQHSHIVRVTDCGIDTTEPETPYLVMTYAPLGTLHDRHPRGSRVPLPIVLAYVSQLAAALDFAHRQKLIHRDVKPENMLLESDQRLLLSDFGITAIAHSTSSFQTQAYAGTVHYSAPEQINGKPVPASDQYALAIVVYEWLVGKRPFNGSSLVEIVMQHLSTPPPPLSGMPLSVELVVHKALAKKPEERFDSVQAFATALEQANEAQEPTFVVPPKSVAQPSDSRPLVTPIPVRPPTPTPVIPPSFPTNQVASPLRETNPAASTSLSAQAQPKTRTSSKKVKVGERGKQEGKLNPQLPKWKRLLHFLFSFVEGIILLRFLLELIGADPMNLVAGFIYALTDLVLFPFFAIFPLVSLHPSQVSEVSTLLAMIIYGVIFWMVLRWLGMSILGRKR